MPDTPSSSSETWSLAAFFLLTFALSWSIGIPLALAHQGLIPILLPSWTHYLVAYGPLLSAFIVTGFTLGSPGLKDLLHRMFFWRVCPKWWLVAFSPLLIGLIIIFLLNRFTSAGILISDLGLLNFLPPLGIAALLLWFLTFGLGEETGWRGFALPRLQRNRSAFTATLILFLFWALWHLPQFFYLFDPTFALGWLVGLFAGAILLTWLYNSASSSILICAIWHACFNFMTASVADTALLPALLSVVVIFWAVLVVIRTKPQHLMSV